MYATARAEALPAAGQDCHSTTVEVSFPHVRHYCHVRGAIRGVHNITACWDRRCLYTVWTPQHPGLIEHAPVLGSSKCVRYQLTSIPRVQGLPHLEYEIPRSFEVEPSREVTPWIAAHRRGQAQRRRTCQTAGEAMPWTRCRANPSRAAAAAAGSITPKWANTAAA